MLPTREEAKEAILAIECNKSSIQKIITQFGRKAKLYDEYINDVKAYSTAISILEAYSSGSLIEARTEGEIEREIHNYLMTEYLISEKDNCSLKLYQSRLIDNKKTLARALVGKV